MTSQVSNTRIGKRNGIYNLFVKSCGCRVKSYTGGKIVVEGCREHKTIIYHKCPSCGKEFFGKIGTHSNGKKEMKKCVWDHAI